MRRGKLLLVAVLLGTVLFLLLALLAGLVEAKTWCMDINGSSSAACVESLTGTCSDVPTSQRRQFLGDRNEGGAQDCMGRGDELIIFPGTYTATSGLGDYLHRLISGFSPTQRTLIRGSDTNNKPVFHFPFYLDGEKIGDALPCAQYFDQATPQVPEYFEIRDIKWTAPTQVSVQVDKCAQDILLNKIHVDGANLGGVHCFTSDRTFRTCHMKDSTIINSGSGGPPPQNGAMYITGKFNIVETSYFNNNGTDGGVTFNPSSESHLRNNTFENCRGRCIILNGSDSYVYDNLFLNSTDVGDMGVQMRKNNGISQNNTFYNMAQGIVVNQSSAVGNIIEGNIFESVTNPIDNFGTSTVMDCNTADVSDTGIDQVISPVLINAAGGNYNPVSGIQSCPNLTPIPGDDNGGGEPPPPPPPGAFDPPSFNSGFATSSTGIIVNIENQRTGGLATCDESKITVSDGTNSDNPALCTITVNQLVWNMGGTTLDPMTSGETITFTATAGWVVANTQIGNEGNESAEAVVSPITLVNQISGGAPDPTFDQVAFRWDNPSKDVVDSAGPALDAEGALGLSENQDILLPPGGGALLRLKISTSAADANPIQVELEYRRNAGSWVLVPSVVDISNCASTAMCFDSSIAPFVSSQEAVDEELSLDEPYVAGVVVFSNSGMLYDFSLQQSSEFVFPVRLPSTATTGDTFDFRVKGMDTYTQTPRATVGRVGWGAAGGTPLTDVSPDPTPPPPPPDPDPDPDPPPPPPAPPAGVLAFPGAEGFGRNSQGGRGGTVYYVTDFGNAGPGTLRDCAEVQSGSRFCLFKNGGTVNLTQEIIVVNPYLSILGQSAPDDSKGVQVTGGGLVIKADHVIVRNVAFRPNVGAGTRSVDACSIQNGSHVIFDHVTCQWGNDGSFDIRVSGSPAPVNVTVSYSIISETFTGHSLNAISDGDNLTWHHNLFSHAQDRHPQPGMCKDSRCQYTGTMQLINNIVYDFKFAHHLVNDAEANPPLKVDIISNLYIEGNQVDRDPAPFRPVDGTDQGELHIYTLDNISVARPDLGTDPESNNWSFTTDNLTILGAKNQDPVDVTIDDVTTLETTLKPKLGALYPARDDQDQRLIDRLTARTAGLCGFPASLCGGVPTMPAGTTIVDTDGDGMSDSYEDANSLDKNDASDGPAQAANDYTNLENYLNERAGDTIP